MPQTVNSQVLESMMVANESVMGSAPSESQSVILEASAYSISLLMLNAVSTQYSASQVANASVATTCAEIIKAGAS